MKLQAVFESDKSVEVLPSWNKTNYYIVRCKMEKDMATHSRSCLENPINRGIWWAKVHGVAKVGHDWATACTRCKKTSGHHYTSIRRTKIQNSDNTKCWQECGATGILTDCWWECKMVQPLWKAVWQIVTKLNILLSYDSTLFTGIYSKELNTHVYRKMCDTDVYSSFTHNYQNLE